MDIMLLLLLYSDTHGLMGIYLVCCWRKLSCVEKRKPKRLCFYLKTAKKKIIIFLPLPVAGCWLVRLRSIGWCLTTTINTTVYIQ